MNGTPALGREARAQWLLRADAIFLNHGSYGACPLPVLAVQDDLRRQLEAHPDAFMDRIKPDGTVLAVRAVARELAAYVGAPEENLAFVENATHGVHAVLHSVALSPGDEVLATDHQYNAVRLAIEARCRDTGALPRVVPLPVSTSRRTCVRRSAASSERRNASAAGMDSHAV
jgi:isopenicillin-N epimerase